MSQDMEVDLRPSSTPTEGSRRFIAVTIPPNHPDPEGALRAAEAAAKEGLLNHLDKVRRRDNANI